jgi:hypothetical protein
MLTRFPLPRGSAEGEVIASSIAARCWLSERQVGMQCFLQMCCCWRRRRRLMARISKRLAGLDELLCGAAAVLERVALSSQAAFLTYGAMEPGTASLMAELLVRGCLWVHPVSHAQLYCIAVRLHRYHLKSRVSVQGFAPDLVLPQLEMYTRDK